MRRLLFLPTFLLALSCSRLPLLPTASAFPVDRVLRSLVMVTYPVLETGETHTCTGFVTSASRGRVLTARHCVVDQAVVFVDGQDPLVIKTDGAFALLSIPPMSKPPLDVGERLPTLGTIVQTYGYGYGRSFIQVLTRHISGFIHGGRDITFDGPLIPGMSGGPVVDVNGAVVGLNQGANEVLGLASGSGEIRAFLDKSH